MCHVLCLANVGNAGGGSQEVVAASVRAAAEPLDEIYCLFWTWAMMGGPALKQMAELYVRTPGFLDCLGNGLQGGCVAAAGLVQCMVSEDVR